MTKEELIQEAEEYAERKVTEYGSTYLDCTPSQFEKYLCNAYLSIIEPREKRIEELEKENAKAKEVIRDLYFVIQDRIDYNNNIPLIDTMERARAILKR